MGCDDKWSQKIEFGTEQKAKQELDWLSSHNMVKEYMLVALIFSDPTDGLNDIMPF